MIYQNIKQTHFSSWTVLSDLDEIEIGKLRVAQALAEGKTDPESWNLRGLDVHRSLIFIMHQYSIFHPLIGILWKLQECITVSSFSRLLVVKMRYLCCSFYNEHPEQALTQLFFVYSELFKGLHAKGCICYGRCTYAVLCGSCKAILSMLIYDSIASFTLTEKL